jgi:hypothetical protein
MKVLRTRNVLVGRHAHAYQMSWGAGKTAALEKRRRTELGRAAIHHAGTGTRHR